MAEIDLNEVIADTRAAAGPLFVSARVEAETEARKLLNDHIGAMTPGLASELGRTLNRHYWGTGVRHNRFLPGFSEPLIKQMVSDIDHFNQVLYDLWRGDEGVALETVDRILTDHDFLPGAGQSFPTVLLYLRFDPRYYTWFNRVDNGLSVISDYPGHTRDDGLDGYREFCTFVSQLREDHGLEPQEVDAVLSEAARRAVLVEVAVEEDATTPTITSEAFQFLGDLQENNSKEWFDANRSRYEQHLRDPLAAVFESVAEQYIRSLDPKLNTEVQRDDVLARINKYAPGVPYYTHYWGAFSRGKKQEDTQLYIIITKDQLHYGLYLGSASREQRQKLADRAEEAGAEYLEALEAHAPGILWDQDDGEYVSVRTPEALAQWALGPNPHVHRILPPDHELIGSPDLVDDIGRVMVALYPLAALTWDERPDVEFAPPAVEDLRPEYSFEQLVADTRLPAELLEEWLGLLRGDKRAGLFVGPPGTGKTWVVEKLARHLAGSSGDEVTVQFHPSFSYEDFIEGLRPSMAGGQLTYEIRDGVFKRFCDEARGKDGDYVFVVDEMNRAELGSVLGEVMMLLEYRGRKVPLPYSQEAFSIPKNVVVLATMNTADRSLALVDFALRRRFHAFRMPPDRDVLSSYLGDDGSLGLQMFDLVQDFVDDPDFSPGHSYWMTSDPSAATLSQIWRYELKPYLEEYWFESRTRLNELDSKVQTLLGEGA